MLAVLLFLVLCSGFFSATETAFTCLNHTRLKLMASEGNVRAGKILALVEDYDKLISSILIGNNIVNILSSSLATVTFVELLGSGGVTVSTAVMTVVILLMGEVAPKSIARVHAEKLAFAVYPLIALIVKLLTPLNFLMGCWQKLVGRLAGSGEDTGVTEEEIMTMVEEAKSDGEIDEHESELIRSAIEFTDMTAEDILTPRVDMDAVEIGDPREEIASKFIETGHTRLPVYEESVDNIVGILNEKDFYHDREKSIRELMTPPICVLPNTRLSALMRLLQEQKSHIAVVMDEYGGVLGIVTLEDILEELVGEIWDEHDEVVEEIRPDGKGRWRVLGSASLEDLRETVDLKKEYESVTVAGWVQEEIGKLPDEGETFDCGDLHVTVLKVLRHHVEEILIEKTEPEGET